MWLEGFWLDFIFWNPGTFLEVQWLRLCASMAQGIGSIPDQGTKIPYAVQPGQKKKKKKSEILLQVGPLNLHGLGRNLYHGFQFLRLFYRKFLLNCPSEGLRRSVSRGETVDCREIFSIPNS